MPSCPCLSLSLPLLLLCSLRSFDSLRPAFVIDGETVRLGMSAIIEIVMLSAAALILLLTRTDGMKATQGSVFPAGMQAVIAIFGIAWMGDTFLQWETCFS